MPTNQQISRINDVLYTIHQDISEALPARALADRAAYSEQHFHRVFQSVVGEPVHSYIRRIRMEFAANQLMFDGSVTVLEVASKSGFSSVSSFSRAFKSMFKVSPGQWRSSGQAAHTKPYLAEPEISEAYQRILPNSSSRPQLLEVAERKVAYIRHRGYDRSISATWETLKGWAGAEGRDASQQFGLHHSNPACVELAQCRYVACLAIESPLLRRSVVNTLTIPGGLHAVFSLTGKYGELLPHISNILEHWLPSSGYKMQSTPAYVHYHKNHFLEADEKFSLDFYLPISMFL